MTPLPKRKLSRSRGRKRRTHQALTIPNLSECPNCHAYKLSHRVCPECGVYNNRTIVVAKAKKENV